MNIECVNLECINWIVAASNIIGVLVSIALFLQGRLKYAGIVFIASILSVMMHLSETKHTLPGIPELREYSEFWLWCDRIYSYSLAAYTVWRLHGNRNYVDLSVWTFGIFGVLACAIGEIGNVSVSTFAILHIYWHFVAYVVMYYVFAH